MKLNLHLHTRYSDGSDSVKGMGLWLKELGHCALVTSDHDYMMNPESYEKQIAESKLVSEEIEFPIINGLEISLWHEEAVLIGTEACRVWMKERAKSEHNTEGKLFMARSTAYELLPGLLDGLSYGLCLVHPHLQQTDLNYGMFHAYETMNSGYDWGKERVEKMKEMMPTARPVKGMDAHGSRTEMKEYYANSCNEVETPLTTEAEIIQWMRSCS
jgi:hypothetical protein